jgi:uncharacterized lipoprotein
MRILIALVLVLGLAGCNSDEVTTTDAAVDAKVADAAKTDAVKPAADAKLDAVKPAPDAAKTVDAAKVDAAATDAKTNNGG